MVLGKRKLSSMGKRPHKKQKVSSKSVRAIVQRVISKDSEFKIYAPSLVQTTVGTTPALADVTAIAQNVAEGGRIGNKLTVRFVKFVGDVTINAASTTSAIFRLSVIQWFPASTPTAASIYETPARSDMSIWNKDTSESFRVLADKRFSLSNAGFNKVIAFNFKARPAKKHNVVQYDSDAVTTGAGHIYYILSGSDNVNKPGIEFYSATYYTDL